MSAEPDLINPVPYRIIEISEKLGLDSPKDHPWMKVDIRRPDSGAKEWPAFCPTCGMANDLTRLIFEEGTYWIGQCFHCDSVLWFLEEL